MKGKKVEIMRGGHDLLYHLGTTLSHLYRAKLMAFSPYASSSSYCVRLLLNC